MLAEAGLGSRRDMEELIRAGRVTVNGAIVTLGAKATSRDTISVDGRPVRREVTQLPRVLLYHKPEGEIVSRDDPDGRPSVFEQLPPVRGGKWLNIGRLDFNTSGLLLFTTSGELANRFAHPRFELEREYAVRILGELTSEEQERLTRGVLLDDGPARMKSIAAGGGEGSNRWYHVVLQEGRNRIVRRMLEAVGHTVSRLIRTRFGPVSLPPGLRRGRWRELQAADVSALLTAMGLRVPQATGASGPRAQSRTPGHPRRSLRAR